MKKLIRLYVAGDISLNHNIYIKDKQAHYLKNVMRVSVGEDIIIFNNSGEFIARVESASKSEAMVTPHIKTSLEDNIADIEVIFSPLKNCKLDEIVKRCSELGAKILQPVALERSIVRKINLEKSKLSAIEAAEQCERLKPVEIYDIDNLQNIICNRKDRTILFADENGAGKSLSGVISDITGKISILIGAEGGFSDNEQQYLLSQSNVVAISLGQLIMRAETAIFASLAITQAYQGNLDGKPNHTETCT